MITTHLILMGFFDAGSGPVVHPIDYVTFARRQVRR